MRVISVEEAQSKLISLMAETTASRQPIQIAGEREEKVVKILRMWTHYE